MGVDDIEAQWQQITDEERSKEHDPFGLGEVITVDGDGPVTSDWHLPLTNFAEAGRMVAHAERLGMGKWLGIAGDFFHNDALSFHNPKQNNANFDRQTNLANRCILRLLGSFDRIIIARGNHDEKLEVRMEHAASFERTVRMMLHELSDNQRKRLVITNRDHFIVNTDEGPWRVCHTRTYSKVQLSYPAKLADVHRMNVAAAHRHHCALGFSPSGYRIAELGGLFDTAATDYLHKWSTDHPKWQGGYMLLKDGRMICPALTG